MLYIDSPPEFDHPENKKNEKRSNQREFNRRRTMSARF